MTKKTDKSGLINRSPITPTKGDLQNFTITKNGVIRCVNISKKKTSKFIY
jgi:hypothetical protein